MNSSFDSYVRKMKESSERGMIMTKPKRTVEILPTFAELQELMDEYAGTVPWVGSVPTVKETQHLAEETDEIAENESKGGT